MSIYRYKLLIYYFQSERKVPNQILVRKIHERAFKLLWDFSHQRSWSTRYFQWWWGKWLQVICFYFLKVQVLLPNYNFKMMLRLCKYCQNGTKTTWRAYSVRGQCLLDSIENQFLTELCTTIQSFRAAIYHILCTLWVSEVTRSSFRQVISMSL